ncbi:MAG: FAD-dependent oxidoreductase [Pseudomonadota bacterium]
MKLLTPLQVGPLTLKNRVVMPPMHLVYCPEGEVTDQLIDFYAERAAGGTALCIVGGCPIDEVSVMYGAPLLTEDRFVPGLARLADAIHKDGALAALQLYQPGRYAFSGFLGGKQSISASPVRSKFTGETPREMTKDDIAWVRGNFAQAARRTREAGYDAVEILGSAGYLISQFLSPITNFRTDEYGGPFENRMRFGLEIAAAVREAAGPGLAVIIRLAGNDFMPGSHTNEDSARFAVELEKKGIDCFSITGGWHETRVPQIPMNLPRGGYAYLAQGIKEKVNKPVIACNRINTPDTAERILRQGRADLIGVGRGLIADPEWVNKTAEGLEDLISVCIGCNQGCFDHVFSLQPINCLVNPRAGFEASRRIIPTETPKKILVAGGGPAGLTFARVAAARGHEVSLYEKDEFLGGQINIAAALPERAEFLTLVQSAAEQALDAGVSLYFGTEVDLELITEEKPDVVVAATGGRPIPAPFPGGDLPHVVQAWDILDERADVGEKVVVVGGGAVGCEAALFVARMGALTPDELHFLFVNQAESFETLTKLANKGIKDVTLLEMTKKIGSDIGQSTGWVIRQDLGRAGINIMTNTKALEITPQGVVVEKDGDRETLPADTVILALGTLPENRLAAALRDKHPRVIEAGDALKPRKAYDAVHQAFTLALEI